VAGWVWPVLLCGVAGAEIDCSGAAGSSERSAAAVGSSAEAENCSAGAETAGSSAEAAAETVGAAAVVAAAGQAGRTAAVGRGVVLLDGLDDRQRNC